MQVKDGPVSYKDFVEGVEVNIMLYLLLLKNRME